jgi:superfamily II DNA or RNA helicase
MSSKHKEAAAFLRSGFFEGLKSFSDFEARTEKLANTKEVGDAFEILVEAYLHLDPILCVKEVWLVGDIPLKIRKSLNLPADSKGIDGVYEDTSGNLIPYQVKYRTDKDTLSYDEVSSFLGITEESLKDRVIFTNARNLAADITKRKGLRGVRAAQFHNLTEEDFKRILAWLCDKKTELKRWTPQPHQKEAVEKITAGLKQANRTTAVMACGTGKTLVALWAAEAQDPKTVLVLVPSLALLSQTLPDWCKQTSWGDRFRYLCVCSDASVDRSAKEDEYALKQSDLEFTVTTEASQVESFLKANRGGVNVIFSTYQSAEVVAAGLKGQAIDLGIFDEAHKTTGPKDGLFAFGLSDKNIRIKKRLFLTATPRHYDLRKRDKDGDFRTISMSDAEVYGKVSYRLSFSAAVAAGIIVPYKVIISVSLNKEVDDELLRRGSTVVRRNQIQAKWVANQIAIKRAIDKAKATKVITFHSRVKLAEEFASQGPQGLSEHVKGFDVFHVNGGQNAADRKALLDAFKTAPRGLVTNARCLTEGVDVPAVDMVAFVDPRKSKIDIAQAAGRAMRQSRATNKKLGYIVVPLFIEQKKGETESAALARSGFEEVAMVLGAMLESDDDLVDIIREMQEARGRGDKFNPKQLHEKIEVIGPAIDLDKLERSIDVEIVDCLGVSWDKWFGLLQCFHQREGHVLVEAKHVEGGLRLGNWVQTQRHTKSTLTPERIHRLNSLGFVWDQLSHKWNLFYSALKTFYEREGHTLVPQTHKENGLWIGNWVRTQRLQREQMPADRLKRLNALGFKWEIYSEQWEKAFEALVCFKKREGHTRVPSSHIENGVNLGTWTQNQRTQKAALPLDRLKRLEAISFCWDVKSETWEQHFQALIRFKKREGHTNVPQRHKEGALRLGTWVNNIRHRKGDEISPERMKRLNDVGFPWDPHSNRWDENYSALQKFYKREGHSDVPLRHKESGLGLGSWVVGQRALKTKLSRERVKRLDSLGFTWSPHQRQWDENFAALIRFKKREGHTHVKSSHQESGLKLGTWVSNQRQSKSKLTADQIKRLNSAGFSWDPRSEIWEQAFTALKSFRKREGHSRVPRHHVENGVRLNAWMQYQRVHKSKLNTDRIKRLDAINFSWDVFSEQWDFAYGELVKFRKQHGHCQVPVSYEINGLKLGRWASTQRSNKSSLSSDRIKRLNSLGFIWKA